MAYFAHYDLWEELAAFCSHHSFTLTVYIDDCTISGQSISRKDMWAIKQIIHASGQRYHKEKTYIDRPAEVTGVIVNSNGIAPPYRQFKKLHKTRMELFTATEETAGSVKNQTAGLRSQIRQITDVNAIISKRSKAATSVE